MGKWEIIKKNSFHKRFVCLEIGLFIVLLYTFLLTNDNKLSAKLKTKTLNISSAEAALVDLPTTNQLLPLSKTYSYPVLKGIKINRQDPFSLDFIIDTKNKSNIDEKELSRLVNYFLAALTIPEKDL